MTPSAEVAVGIRHRLFEGPEGHAQLGSDLGRVDLGQTTQVGLEIRPGAGRLIARGQFTSPVPNALSSEIDGSRVRPRSEARANSTI